MKLFPWGSVNNPDLPKTDQGSGSLDNYNYNLAPKNKKVTILLADSGPNQDAIRAALDQGETEPEAFITRRTIEDERTDAPTPVRLFVNKRPTPVVGFVPRGLEPAVEAALGRLTDRGDSPRIPTRIVSTRNGLRVELKIGLTR
jgi:hypothetical protein